MHNQLHRIPHRLLSQPAQRLQPTSLPPRPKFHRQSSKWRSPAPTSTHFSNPSPKPDPTPHPTSDPRTRLLLSYHDLERALERRGLKSVRTLISATIAILAGVGLMWPRIKRWGAVETAEVAAASLETEQLQTSATAMVHDVLTDPKTEQQVEAVLKKAVIRLFEDEEFTERAVGWTAQVLGEALKWESLREEGVNYLKGVLEEESSKEVAEEYLREAVGGVVQDEQVQDSVARGIWQGVRASVVGRRRGVERVEVEEKVEREKAEVAATEPAA